MAGLAVNHGEGRAEGLVALDETIERHRERLDVERSSHRNRRVQVVDRMARVKTVMKPEPPLLERHRTGHRRIAPRDGSGIVLEPRGRRFPRLSWMRWMLSCHPRHSGGLVKNRGQWKIDPEDFLHLPEELDRAERIAAEQKEIFVRVNACPPRVDAHSPPTAVSRAVRLLPPCSPTRRAACELAVKAQELRHLGSLQLTACSAGKFADAEDPPWHLEGCETLSGHARATLLRRAHARTGERLRRPLLDQASGGEPERHIRRQPLDDQEGRSPLRQARSFRRHG